MAKKIKHIGEKRKNLSQIFNLRNVLVTALNNDDVEGYNAFLVTFKKEVAKMEAA